MSNKTTLLLFNGCFRTPEMKIPWAEKENRKTLRHLTDNNFSFKVIPMLLFHCKNNNQLIDNT